MINFRAASNRRMALQGSIMITKIAKIQTDKCKGCCYCVDVCSKGAITKSGKSNKKGYDYIEVNEAVCNGCGACYIVCPDCCITIIEND